MSTFIICYDLEAPVKDYKRIQEGIEKLSNARDKILESTWIIEHAGPAQSIHEHLKSYVDANDKFVVIELAADYASFNITNDLPLKLKRTKAKLEELKEDLKKRPK